MAGDEMLLFNKTQSVFPLYLLLRDKLRGIYPEMEIKVGTSMVSFRNKHVFAMASPPWRKHSGWPCEYLLVSFGLPYKKESPRIVEAVEPYPKRWTHHVIVVAEDELDDELMTWLDEAYQFAQVK